MKFSVAAIFCVLFGLISVTEARVGEGKSRLESRLLGSGGVVYRNDEVEENRMRGMPYLQYLPYLEGSVEVRIYFKTDDGRQAKSSQLEAKKALPGWDLHVVYVRGVSAIEVYKRSGASASEYEINEILARNAEGKYWQRSEKQVLAEGEEEVPTAFNFDMERSDKALRAKKMGGNGVMIFTAEVDTALANLKESDLIQSAPISTSGF